MWLIPVVLKQVNSIQITNMVDNVPARLLIRLSGSLPVTSTLREAPIQLRLKIGEEMSLPTRAFTVRFYMNDGRKGQI